MVGILSSACCFKVLLHLPDCSEQTKRKTRGKSSLPPEPESDSMNPDDAIDFSREAIKTCMMVGGPILVASLLLGLLIGVFQAMTQVQDQTVSFVPKILLLIVMIGLCLPWLTDRMMDFATQSFEKPMTQWAGTTSTSTSIFSNTPIRDPAPNQQLHTQSKTASTPPTAVASAPTPQVRLASSQRFPSSSPQSEPPTNPTASPPSPVLESNRTEDGKQNSPLKTPFILPHYRTVKPDKTDLGG